MKKSADFSQTSVIQDKPYPHDEISTFGSDGCDFEGSVGYGSSLKAQSEAYCGFDSGEVISSSQLGDAWNGWKRKNQVADQHTEEYSDQQIVDTAARDYESGLTISDAEDDDSVTDVEDSSTIVNVDDDTVSQVKALAFDNAKKALAEIKQEALAQIEDDMKESIQAVLSKANSKKASIKNDSEKAAVDAQAQDEIAKIQTAYNGSIQSIEDKNAKAEAYLKRHLNYTVTTELLQKIFSGKLPIEIGHPMMRFSSGTKMGGFFDSITTSLNTSLNNAVTSVETSISKDIQTLATNALNSAATTVSKTANTALSSSTAQTLASKGATSALTSLKQTLSSAVKEALANYKTPILLGGAVFAGAIVYVVAKKKAKKPTITK